MAKLILTMVEHVRVVDNFVSFALVQDAHNVIQIMLSLQVVVIVLSA